MIDIEVEIRVSKFINFSRRNLFLPLNPFVVYVALVYGLMKIFQFFHMFDVNFWPNLWRFIVYESVPEGDFTRDRVHDYLVYYLPLQSSLFFWFLCMMFTLVAYLPSFEKFLVQPNENIPWEKMPKASLFLSVFINIFINQIVVTILVGKFTVALLENIFNINLVMYARPEAMPTFLTLMMDLISCNLLLDVASFSSHRLMHTSFFYKRFHKMHHEFKVPLPLASIYNHPVEHFIMNLSPVFIGIIVTRAHLPTALIWMMINLFCGVTDHANVHLPLLKSPRLHNFHHEVFVGNYGITGLSDFLCGTDKHFRESDSYKKHTIILPMFSSFLSNDFDSENKYEKVSSGKNEKKLE